MAPAEAEEKPAQVQKPAKKPRSFRIFGGTFTFRLIPTIIAAVMLAMLIGLGCWQIERLHWKENLIAEIHQRMDEMEIDVGLSTILPETVPQMDYHPGRAAGLMLNDKAFYLNATSVNNGAGGYDVLTPLMLDDGRYLLVNRGWMPYALKDKPGEGASETLYRPVGPVEVKGILRIPPSKKPGFRPENDPGKNEWYWVDLPAMALTAGVKEFLPYVLEAEDAPHDGSYPIGGQTRVDLPNHHLNYALTWFWLALILPIIYFISNWQHGAAKKPEEAEKAEPKKSE